MSRPSCPSCPSCLRLAAPAWLELLVLLVGRRLDCLPKRALEALGERARGVVATRLQQLIARGDFDEDGDVTSRRDGHPDQRNPQTKDFVEAVVEAEPFVLARRIPAFQLHDELHALR